MNIPLLILLCCINGVYASTVIPGNATSNATSFANPVQQMFLLTVPGRSSIGLFAGAQNSGAGSWALTYYNPVLKNSFYPIATTTAVINGSSQGKDNPLCGAAITQLSGYVDGVQGEISYVPVAVAANNPRLFAVTKLPLTSTDIATILQSDPLNDASGAVTSEIKGLAMVTSLGLFNRLMFAAVKGNGQTTFGDPNSTNKSGITYTTIASNMLQTYNATTGAVAENLAALFDTSIAPISAVVNDGTPTSSQYATPLTDAVCMHWDPVLSRVYIGISAQANSTAPAGSVGVRSVVVGQLNAGKIVFYPIVPFSALTDNNNQIVGSLTDNTQTAIATASALSTMYTSSGLNYLIVVGGNNTEATTGNTVYALPLVNNVPYISQFPPITAQETVSFEATQGTIAATDSTITYFNRTKGFTTPATTAAQMTTTSDTAAIVGGGTVPVFASNGITNLIVSGDTVYVTVAQNYASAGGQLQEPGVFASQAILNQNGQIIAWTPWRRVGGNDSQMLNAAVDPVHGVFLLGTSSTGGTGIDTIATTSWSYGSNDGLLGGTSGNAAVGLVNTITTAFQTVGGIQSLQDYTPTQTGFAGSMMIGTGYQKIVAALSGYQYPAVPDSLVPMKGDFATGALSDTNDTFPTPVDTDPATTTNKFFTITGTAISSLGAITCSTIAYTGTQYYMIVGGTGGVAILTDNNGDGYTTYPYGLQFRRLGHFTNVVRVVADTQNVYVLTSSALYRVALNAANIIAGTSDAVPVATINTLPTADKKGAMCDLIVTGQFALLATTRGLYRTANDTDIRSIASLGGWLPVRVPEGLGVATQFAWISPTGLMSGLQQGGTITLFESYIGQYQARLNRFYLSMPGGGVSDTVLQPLNDQFEQGKNSYFVDYGQFKNMYASDGTIYLTSAPITLVNQSLLSLLPPYTRSGELFPSANSVGVMIALKQGAIVSSLSRSAAAGTWLVAGTFGLLVNE